MVALWWLGATKVVLWYLVAVELISTLAAGGQRMFASSQMGLQQQRTGRMLATIEASMRWSKVYSTLGREAAMTGREL